jgi:hypothetical protein
MCCTWGKINPTGLSSEYLNERDCLEGMGVDRMKTLKLILQE